MIGGSLEQRYCSPHTSPPTPAASLAPHSHARERPLAARVACTYACVREWVGARSVGETIVEETESGEVRAIARTDRTTEGGQRSERGEGNIEWLSS